MTRLVLLVAAASIAFAQTLPREPLRLLAGTAGLTRAEFVLARPGLAAYRLGRADAPSTLAAVFSSEARTADEANELRAVSLRVPLDERGHVTAMDREAVVSASLTLQRACGLSGPRGLEAELRRLGPGQQTRGVRVEPALPWEAAGPHAVVSLALGETRTPSCSMPRTTGQK